MIEYSKTIEMFDHLDIESKIHIAEIEMDYAVSSTNQAYTLSKKYWSHKKLNGTESYKIFLIDKDNCPIYCVTLDDIFEIESSPKNIITLIKDSKTSKDFPFYSQTQIDKYSVLITKNDPQNDFIVDEAFVNVFKAFEDNANEAFNLMDALILGTTGFLSIRENPQYLKPGFFD